MVPNDVSRPLQGRLPSLEWTSLGLRSQGSAAPPHPQPSPAPPRHSALQSCVRPLSPVPCPSSWVSGELPELREGTSHASVSRGSDWRLAP